MKSETEPLPTRRQPQRQRSSWRELLRTEEGRVLLIGLALALLGLAALIASWLLSPTQSQVLVAMTATNVLLGRAASMSFGYAMGLGNHLVVPANMFIETVLVLLFYPLFVFSWQRLVEVRLLRRFIERTATLAEENRATIRRYGVPGLLLFVCLPFWMTGPVVGCAIGFLLGMRAWQNLAVVLTATYIAVIGWALLLRRLHDHVTEYSVFGPMALVVLIVLIAVAGSLLHGARNHRFMRDGRE